MRLPVWIARPLVFRKGNPPRRRDQIAQKRRALYLEVLEDRCTPAVFTVTTLSDVVDANDGLVSLREAIVAANTDTEAGGVTGSGADEIQFASSLFTGGAQTLTMTGGQYTIQGILTITGPGQDLLTINANSASRHFIVTGGGSNLFTLRDVTLKNGNSSSTSGGSITTAAGSASINIDRVTFDSNTMSSTVGGGAIYAGGALTVTDSIFTNNNSSSTNTSSGGGAIYSVGASLSVSGSTFTGNQGENAGAIYYNRNSNGGGLITIVDSTFSGNTARTKHGGALNVNKSNAKIFNSTFNGNSAGGNGGGIFTTQNGNIEVRNSTFSGNTADQGAAITFGSQITTVVNNTVVNNTASTQAGGIWFRQSTTWSMYNTIVAGNTATTVAMTSDVYSESRDPSVAYNNLIGDPDSTGGIVNGTDGNIVGSNGGTTVLDLSTVLELTLADNGGPTLTHALVQGSVAINAGDDDYALDDQGDPLLYDQRGTGFDRFIETVDIGSFELQVIIPQGPTEPTIDPNGDLPDDGTPISGADVVIEPDSSVTSDTIQQQSSPLAVTNLLQVLGGGKSVILDNLDNMVSAMLEVSNVKDFTLVATGNVTITEFDVTGNVNLIIDGDLTVPADVYASLVLSGSIQANNIYVYGTLGGSGTITATHVTVSSGGLWSVGNSPGTVTVLGDIDYSGGTIAVDIESSLPGDYDVTHVTGAVSLTGATLTLNLAGYNPYRGEQITLITATGGITGNFANLSGGTISQSGITFSIVNNGTAIILSPIALPPATNTTFVQQLYTDILGRSADTAGLNSWVAQLNNGASRESVVQAIYNSTEHYNDMVQNYYQTYLGRAADAAGLANWVAELQRGVSETVVIRGFLASAEYFELHGSSNSSFLRALYPDLLGRNIDSAGMSTWMAALLSGQSRDSVIASIQASSEYLHHLIDLAYEDQLRREPDSQGDADWYDQLSGGLTAGMLNIDLYASDEYYSNS